MLFYLVIVLSVLLHSYKCMVYGLATEVINSKSPAQIHLRVVRATSDDGSSTSNATDRCIPTISDQQDYYKMVKTNGSFDYYWIELAEDRKHHGLSLSSGAYETVNLTFGFPFFGHIVSQVQISTAGIISMVADNHESRVSHYITPFLGHFNPSRSSNSAILFESRNEVFIIEWRNVLLRTSNETENPGPFQFQSVINRNGTIMFLYKKVPLIAIPHTTFAGLHSGVYVKDKAINAFVSYRAIDLFKDDLRENTVITFSPKSMCDLATHSKTCNARGVRFYCKDCNITKHCDYRTFKGTHKWLENNCNTAIPEECNKGDETSGSLTKTIVITVFAIVILVFLAVLSGWFYYAYTRPTSPSGRWLISHRPSQWIGLIKNRRSATDDTISSTSKDDDDDPGY